jgi:WD40 repeat protein
LSAVTFSPDGRFLAAGLGSGHLHPNDGRLLVWDISRTPAKLVSEASVVAKEAKESYDVTGVVSSRDGKTLISADQHGVLRTWSVDEHGHIAAKQTIQAHRERGGIQSLALFLDNCVVSSGYDGFVNVWDVKTGKALRHWSFGHGAATVLTVAPSRKHLAVGLSNGAVYILRLENP